MDTIDQLEWAALRLMCGHARHTVEAAFRVDLDQHLHVADAIHSIGLWGPQGLRRTLQYVDLGKVWDWAESQGNVAGPLQAGVVGIVVNRPTRVVSTLTTVLILSSRLDP